MSAWLAGLWTGPFLPLLALAWPLILGMALVAPPLRRRPLVVLPLAPLPALVLAVMGAGGMATEAPSLLLGVELRLDAALHPFFLMSALLWLAAGAYAQGMARESGGQGDRQAIFAGFWCLTLSGNLGVFLAQDAASFYVAFAAVSLAAWFLVVHARTDQALAAGRLYILLAVAGEIALLAGLLIGVQAAGGTAIADIRANLPEAPLGALAAGLMAAGFAIKAGIVPLHVWLPLAHPAAPVAGSAVLSGAIVKAGLVGLMLLVPPGWGASILVTLGLAGAFGAALWGLTQENPKAVLAYSTVSQMGLMAALLGAGSGVVAGYALHHGLAKGALFLGAGLVMAAAAGRGRAFALVLCALAAASVAGLPLSGGAAAKAAAKADIAPALAMALTLSGATTALLMGWFLYRLTRGEGGKARVAPAQLAPLAVLVTAALALPWVLWPEAATVPRLYALGTGAMADAAWPAALGLGAGALALAMRWQPTPRPPGDILALLPSSGTVATAARRLTPALTEWPNLRRPSLPTHATPAALAARAEAVMRRWPLSGVAMAATVIVLAALALL
ncbi:MAG: hypothetical protein JJT95_16820 [Pararhodobacter sp.]|nr:hypothetical protein [Pararhodobacter sp.]